MEAMEMGSFLACICLFSLEHSRACKQNWISQVRDGLIQTTQDINMINRYGGLAPFLLGGATSSGMQTTTSIELKISLLLFCWCAVLPLFQQEHSLYCL